MPDTTRNVNRHIKPATREYMPDEGMEFRMFMTGIEKREVAYNGEDIFNAGEVEAERSEECVS